MRIIRTLNKVDHGVELGLKVKQTRGRQEEKRDCRRGGFLLVSCGNFSLH